VLADLLASRAASTIQGGAPQLIDQSASVFCRRDGHHYLQALRSQGDTAVVDALLALHEERQRRDNERMQQWAAQE
jgi:hypothetical protein